MPENNKPKVLIGITTYNRKTILDMMSQSLYESNLSMAHSIRVYDDNSTEYGEEEIRKLFPDAEKITVRKINVGADANTWGMYCDFLGSDCDYFFNADSDLIFSKNWLENGLRFLEDTDGVISLFNTPLYDAVEEKGDIIVKKIFGAAGTLFSRECINELVEANNAGVFSPDFIDWGFCKYFNEQGKKLYCTKKSYVQHIGLYGFNCDTKGFAYGDYFVVDSLHNGQAINDVLCGFEETRKTNVNVQGYYLFPFDKVMKNSRVLIYGAGKVGKDYVRQIEQSRFCKLVAVLDRRFDNKTVFAPEKISEFEFDVIIIATVKKEFAGEIKQKVLMVCPELTEERIVVADDRIIRI